MVPLPNAPHHSTSLSLPSGGLQLKERRQDWPLPKPLRAVGYNETVRLWWLEGWVLAAVLLPWDKHQTERFCVVLRTMGIDRHVPCLSYGLRLLVEVSWGTCEVKGGGEGVGESGISCCAGRETPCPVAPWCQRPPAKVYVYWTGQVWVEVVGEKKRQGQHRGPEVQFCLKSTGP